jgi:hypothetical protein
MAIFCLATIFFTYRIYSNYTNMVSELENPKLFSVMYYLDSFTLCNGGFPRDKNEFDNYLINRDSLLYGILSSMDYSIKSDKNELFLYSSGFDGKDDLAEKIYSIKDVTWITSFFKTGDILLFKTTISSTRSGIDNPIFYSEDCNELEINTEDLNRLRTLIRQSLNRFYQKKFGIDTTKTFIINPENSKFILLHCITGEECKTDVEDLFADDKFHVESTSLLQNLGIKAYYFPIVISDSTAGFNFD